MITQTKKVVNTKPAIWGTQNEQSSLVFKVISIYHIVKGLVGIIQKMCCSIFFSILNPDVFRYLFYPQLCCFFYKHNHSNLVLFRILLQKNKSVRRFCFAKLWIGEVTIFNINIFYRTLKVPNWKRNGFYTI